MKICFMEERLKDLMKFHREDCSGTMLLNPQKQGPHFIHLLIKQLL